MKDNIEFDVAFKSYVLRKFYEKSLGIEIGKNIMDKELDRVKAEKYLMDTTVDEWQKVILSSPKKMNILYKKFNLYHWEKF